MLLLTITANGSQDAFRYSFLWKHIWRFAFTSYIFLVIRYTIIAGAAFMFFYVLKRGKYAPARIQDKFPKNKDYYREIAYSVLSSAVFAFYVALFTQTPIRRYTLIYDHISDKGWLYFVVSIMLCLLMHETWFYWTHRLMHHPRLFKSFHTVHHKSTNPSPWAAFSFQLSESMVEAGIVPFIVFLVPIHGVAFLIFFTISTALNVYDHLGYEIYPRWLIKSRAGKWLNTSVGHNMHHKYFHGNYGLYTGFWDIVANTVHPEYGKTLDKILDKRSRKATETSTV